MLTHFRLNKLLSHYVLEESICQTVIYIFLETLFANSGDPDCVVSDLGLPV